MYQKDDYKINEILGEKFRQLMPVIESGILDQFLYKESDKKIDSLSTDKPDPNDVWYQLVEYLIAAAAAFKEIENPDITKVQISEKYAAMVNTISI